MKGDISYQLPLRLWGGKKWLRDTGSELAQFGVALVSLFVAKLALILKLLIRAGAAAIRAFPEAKIYFVRKLVWSRGRLGRPVAHFAVLGLASGVFLTGGLLSGTSLVRSETIKGDVLIASADILPGVTTPTTEVLVNRPRTEPIEYPVREGDTLSSIGEMFKISTDTIRYANDLGDADYLSIGQKLTILPVSGLEYTVKAGDTVQSIAENYQVASQVVIDFNYLEEPFALHIGQAVIVPGAVVPTSTAAVPTALVTGDPGYSSSYAYGYQPSSGSPGEGGWVPQWPTNSAYITQYFSYWHPAIDIAEFSPIYAAGVGSVVRAGWWPQGYGYAVQLDHGNGYTTTYAHMSRIDVSVGQQVGSGQVLGLMGNTGRSFGTHLHFVIQYYGQYRNPMEFF